MTTENSPEIEAPVAVPDEAVEAPQPVVETPEPSPVAPALPVPETMAALPEGHLPEPPKPLMVGAFLRLEYEIKDVIARGLTNLYVADGGAYGESNLVLIAEREAQNDWPEIALESPLFPAGERFTQEERDYLLFDDVPGTGLQDFRAPTNDETYLRILVTLAEGLAELESKGLSAELSRETLLINQDGELHYFGFTSPANQSAPTALEQLSNLSDYLLKRALSEAVTIRLDDEFGSLVMSEEVKTLARRLNDGEFEDVAQVAAAVRETYAFNEPCIEAALLTDVGQERELNEDGGFIWRYHRAAHLGSCKFDLYVVSDGMGGHEGGEVASDLTMSALHDAIQVRATQVDWNDNVTVRNVLLEVIDEVNGAVVDLTQSPAFRSKRAKPGATLTFALRVGRRVFVGNVGDSRAYKWNEAEGLQRISKDHSYVQMLIDAGDITEEEAWDHPEGSVITANIGDPKLRYKDVFLRLFKPGDKLLIVSDGVVDMLRDTEIAPLLVENDPHEVVRDLIDASNTAGGADNITALCVVFR